MGRRGRSTPRKVPATQRLLPFRERAERLDRRFRLTIAIVTASILAGTLVGVPIARNTVTALVVKSRWAFLRRLGAEPERAEVDAEWRRRRTLGIEQLREVIQDVYDRASPESREFFRESGLAPDEAVIRWGNVDLTFLLSSKVFAVDDSGRSYRLLPNVRSIWLRQRVMPKPNTGQLLVPDTPEMRRAIARSGGEILEQSAQTTNSWGCRGPEPDLTAPLRGIVLGDSYMQGVLIGDAETPPECLRRALAEEVETPVSILNTGVLGYSPEQYYSTLREYGDRFRPRFVVVSLFANDFGREEDVLRGEGDWQEAAYWIHAIQQYCARRQIICLVSPVVCGEQLVGPRPDGNYPGQIVKATRISGLDFLNPIEEFLEADRRLRRGRSRPGSPSDPSPLYNGRLGDGHFSAEGAELWGHIVARRLALLLER
jgi:hypothetical protein